MTKHNRPSSPRTPKPSRRDFLAQTAALAGAGFVLGACNAIGLQPDAAPIPKAAKVTPPGPDDAVRMAVIGTGGMGTAHALSIMDLAKKGLENVHVVAVSDCCVPRMDRIRVEASKRQEFEVDGHQDYREVLARDDVHGVLIASPEHWHAKMAEDAIAAGKDVYVEKPMTLRLPEALRLRQVVANNPDVRVQVGTQFLMHEKYNVAQRLIADGAIGKPTFSQTGYCRNSKDGEWLYKIEDWVPGPELDWKAWCGPAGAATWDPEVYYRWRRFKDWSTGIVGDLLVHVTTPLVAALDQGWPTRVAAIGGHYRDQEMENHDQVNIVVQFEKGHTLTICGSTCNEQGVPTMIRGHQASLYLGGKDCVIRPERPFAEEIDEETFTCEPQSGDQDRLRLNWLSCIRTREQVKSPVDLGAQIMVIVDLATRSMWEGSAFEFDPETMTARAV